MSLDLNRRLFGLGALALPLMTGSAIAATRTGARPGPFLIGADVTWIAEDEAAGAEYYLGGVKTDPFAILKDAGFNAVRLRTFVNPENGYSRREPAAAWGGLAQTIKLGQRVRAAGLGLTLSFHYSDTWADPYHQTTPAAWSGLDPAALALAVHDYTRDVLAAMRAAGARVDMAIIGNETSYGMLWPTGQLPIEDPADPNKKGLPAPDPAKLSAAYDAFAPLLKAGIAGAKAADPQVLIQIHNHVGHSWTMVRDWTDALVARGVDYDVMGISCYQQEAQGDWALTLNEFVKRYPGKGILVGEYSSRKTYVNDLVRALPDKRGWGTYIWEPTRHQEAIFDRDGQNAGGGARPDLLKEGSGKGPPPAPPLAPGAVRRQGTGGKYEANAVLEEFRKIARAAGV